MPTTMMRGHVQAMSYDEQSAVNGLENLDAQSIGAVYDQYFPEVYRYVRYRLNNDTVAEDIASDVFVRLLEASEKKQGPRSNIKGWLIGTASNVVNDYLRRMYRRPTESLSDSMEDKSTNIRAEVDLREQNRAVKAAYIQLTLDQQHVLALRFGQGYSLEETATFMNKKVNAVKALQFRALQALQRLIGESNDE